MVPLMEGGMTAILAAGEMIEADLVAVLRGKLLGMSFPKLSCAQVRYAADAHFGYKLKLVKSSY